MCDCMTAISMPTPPTTPSYEDQRVADDYWWLKQQLGVDADPVDTGLDNSWVVRPWIYEESTILPTGSPASAGFPAPP